MIELSSVQRRARWETAILESGNVADVVSPDASSGVDRRNWWWRSSALISLLGLSASQYLPPCFSFSR